MGVGVVRVMVVRIEVGGRDVRIRQGVLCNVGEKASHMGGGMNMSFPAGVVRVEQRRWWDVLGARRKKKGLKGKEGREMACLPERVHLEHAQSYAGALQMANSNAAICVNCQSRRTLHNSAST